MDSQLAWKIKHRDTEVHRAYDSANQHIDGNLEMIKYYQEEIEKMKKENEEHEKVVSMCVKKAKEMGFLWAL